ncbi:MAG TPA: hypothetical protein VFF10_09425 [Trueperaceae bacterium]|nr:hypothetical protein [Trueperaceae bacterium]
MASLSGSDALRAITDAIRQEQERTRKLDADLAAANAQLLELDVERKELLGQLAEVRVKYLLSSEVAAELKRTDEQVLDLLESRDEATEAVQSRLDDLESRQADLLKRREDLHGQLEAASTAIDVAELEAQRELAQDPAYVERQRAARAAERVAVHADEKATTSEQEQGSKGKAYRADPLFMYLWNRGFGTTAYRAGGFVKWLDGKVARLIGYEEARANYARLIDLPVQLRRHAERMGELADAEFAQLKELDEQALVDAGVPELEADRARLGEVIAEVDTALSEIAEAMKGELVTLETFAKGEDEPFRKAIGYLTSEFGRDDLKALRRDALATPYPEDDVVVARLLDLEAAKERQSRTVAELKEVASSNRERLSELEEVRREFTKRRYDDPGSTFSNGNVFGTVLSQLLMGALTSQAFWRVLQQQHTYRARRADPRFGSGGFGRGSVWGPAGRIGAEIGSEVLGEVLGGLGEVLGGGSKRGKGGWGGGGSWGGSFGGTGRARSSRGGFKTGGRIRGGKGFKTGGKF